MERIIECVPNFSEGRNKEVIASIVNAIEKSGGVKVLDVDPGEATNLKCSKRHTIQKGHDCDYPVMPFFLHSLPRQSSHSRHLKHYQQAF